MSRLIDEDQLLDDLMKMDLYRVLTQADRDELIQAIYAQDTVITDPKIILCRDCHWWTKQKKSSQGKCALLGMYPTGSWFCGNATKKK